MKNISIVIITYNRPDDTLDLLNDITELNYPDLLKDVIVVNNASTTDYTEVNSFIEHNKEIPFKFINAPENYGVAGGRNYATRFAEGEILLYVDDDVNLKDKDTLKKINEIFSTEEIDGRKLGVISFKVLYTVNLQMQKTALPHKQFEKYKDQHEFLTYYYAGCAHAKLKEAWYETGEYPSNFFYGMEEYDFSFRLLNKGYCIKYDDSVVILHKESPFGRSTKAEKLRLMWINKSKVAWRYLPKKFFYSTVIMWSVQYLRKSGFNLKNFFEGWKQIFKIPSSEKRSPLKQDTLDYLRKVEARLWY